MDRSFYLEPRKGMNLLEALLRIQDEQDGTLSFRYSCRGAVCGSCAMKVNGKVVLACRTHVEDFLDKPAFIEPLPYFPVLRDLIVDMSAFLLSTGKQNLPSWRTCSLRSGIYHGRGETEGDRSLHQLYPLWNLFWGLPGLRKGFSIFGPAMLAKAYRFLIDPREKKI